MIINSKSSSILARVRLRANSRSSLLIFLPWNLFFIPQKSNEYFLSVFLVRLDPVFALDFINRPPPLLGISARKKKYPPVADPILHPPQIVSQQDLQTEVHLPSYP